MNLFSTEVQNICTEGCSVILRVFANGIGSYLETANTWSQAMTFPKTQNTIMLLRRVDSLSWMLGDSFIGDRSSMHIDVPPVSMQHKPPHDGRLSQTIPRVEQVLHPKSHPPRTHAQPWPCPPGATACSAAWAFNILSPTFLWKNRHPYVPHKSLLACSQVEFNIWGNLISGILNLTSHWWILNFKGVLSIWESKSWSLNNACHMQLPSWPSTWQSEHRHPRTHW